jgi:hypothetical protein
MLQKYDAELTKYWLDRGAIRIRSNCRIRLPVWFTELRRKYEPDGL